MEVKYKKILLSQRGLSVRSIQGHFNRRLRHLLRHLMGSAVGPYNETIDETTFIKAALLSLALLSWQTLISIAHGRRVDARALRTSSYLQGLYRWTGPGRHYALNRDRGVFSIEYSRWHNYNTQRSIMEDWVEQV